MEQLIEFAGNHAILVASLFVVLALLAFNLMQAQKNSVDPVGATQLINREDAIVIDVRPMADFHNGHIVNARSIPLNGFKNQIHSLEKFKQTPIVVSCKSGNQSGSACSDLRKAGFEKVYNLRGGLHAWEAEKLPISKK
jgi:rhodanese-related sulfurtransferase